MLASAFYARFVMIVYTTLHNVNLFFITVIITITVTITITITIVDIIVLTITSIL